MERERERDMYYEELAHVIMEAVKVPSQKSTQQTGTPREPVPLLAGLRPKNPCFSSSPKGKRRSMSQPQRVRQKEFLLFHRRPAFVCYVGLQLI